MDYLIAPLIYNEYIEKNERLFMKKQLLQYFNLKKDIYKESTQAEHMRMIINLSDALSSLKVRKLKSIDINTGYKIITYLKNNTRNGNNSINRHIRYLKKVMLHNNIITSFNKLEMLASDSRPFKRFMTESLKLIIDYVKNMNTSKNSIVYKAMVLLLLDSGMRKGEALNVEIQNIDFEREVIYLGVTKTGLPRYAPFSSFCKKELLEIIALNPDRKYLLYNFLKDRELSDNDVKLFYRRLKDKLKIDRIHTHRFRKTFGSILSENGMPIEHIQRVYNHSRITTTMIYIQHTQSRALDEYKKYNNWGIS